MQVHGLRLSVEPVERLRSQWLGEGIPSEQIDRAVNFDQRWGGLVLPPAPEYEGGPGYLSSDFPEPGVDGGWTIGAGSPRVSIPYSFAIGPNGEFGIEMQNAWAPLHSSIEGWIESLALASHAFYWSKQITVLQKDEVDAIAWADYEQVPEVAGLADTWWRGPDSFIALYTGISELFSNSSRTARIYSGLDEWALGWPQT